MNIRRRLDVEMVRRELVESRQAARREIEAGRVVVGGSPAGKPARLVAPGEPVRLLGPPPRFVSRAGLKLDHGLDTFGIDVAGCRGVDAGSSTGGFTDCLLQRGASAVVAIDIGTNQLHERLRADPRVQVLEQTDVRSVTADQIGGPADVVVADLSFISLRLVVESLGGLARPGAPIVVLVKPQFEAGHTEAARTRGVIRDPDVWRRVLREVAEAAATAGLEAWALTPSPITGTTGNVEFLACLSQASTSLEPVDTGPGPEMDVEAEIDRTVAEAEARVC